MIRCVFSAAALFLAVAGSSFAVPVGVDSTSPSLPAVDGQYVAPPGYQACYAVGAFCFGEMVLDGFTNIVGSFDGAGQHLTYVASVSGFAVTPGFSGHAVFTGAVGLTVFGRTSDGETGTFATEMISLNLFDPFGARIRESPTLLSLGQTTITPIPGGFHIDSFFDVFTDLSIDGGNAWIPNDGGPANFTLTETPEPSSWMLMSLGVGLHAITRRTRRAER